MAFTTSRGRSKVLELMVERTYRILQQRGLIPMDQEEKKKIKLLILSIAEMLDVTLSERKLLIYAKALEDLGAEGLSEAYRQMLADPWVRPGKMLMPGQIRELAQGSIDTEADYSAMQIMRVIAHYDSPTEWKANLTEEQFGLCKAYGLETLRNMQVGQSPTIMAQLRGLCKTQAVTRRRFRANERALTHGGGENLAVQAVLESQEESEAGYEST